MTRLTPDDHFLSTTNPLATSEQRDQEALALRILEMPVVAAARENMARRWKIIAGRDAPAEAWTRFDELVEEFTFGYVLKAVNGDPNHPRVLQVFMPPHEWFGMRLPGSRSSGGDGPDQAYVIIPFDSSARFEITGRSFDDGPADVPLTLTGNPSLTMTISSLDLRSVPVAEDGTFTITVGPDPADGRPDHLQTHPGAMYLFIRDCRSDWIQVPNAYRVRRLDPPTAPPWTDEQIANRAAQMMVEDVPAMYWWMATCRAIPLNTISPPIVSGSYGGLVSQMGSFGQLHVADDEALVITATHSDATYASLTLYDYWFRSIEYPAHTSSLTSGHSVPEAGGTTTYVVAHQDPGVHNWLDPVGLHDLLIVGRWQGLSGGPAPTVEARLVKLADLDDALPQDIARVTPEQRRIQLAERQAAYQLRLIDH